MYEFQPGESKIAIAPITISPSGISCEAELFLGPDDQTKVATSGMIGFVSTGAEQDMILPIIMPADVGTYHVYLDVYAGGVLMGVYQATEDVLIEALAFTFGIPSVTSRRCSIASYNHPDVYCMVTNNTQQTLTKTIYAMCYHGAGGTTPDPDLGETRYIEGQPEPYAHYLVLTLAPGQSYNVHSPHEYEKPDGDMKCSSPALWPNDSYGFWMEDEDGNMSPITPWP